MAAHTDPVAPARRGGWALATGGHRATSPAPSPHSCARPASAASASTTSATRPPPSSWNRASNPSSSKNSSATPTSASPPSSTPTSDSASSRTPSTFSAAPSTTLTRARQRGRPVQVSARAEFVEDEAVERRPEPSGGPFGEAAVRGRPRRAEDRRRLPPGAAGRGHEDDRRADLSVPVPAPASALRPGRSRWYHPLEQFPQPVPTARRLGSRASALGDHGGGVRSGSTGRSRTGASFGTSWHGRFPGPARCAGRWSCGPSSHAESRRVPAPR